MDQGTLALLSKRLNSCLGCLVAHPLTILNQFYFEAKMILYNNFVGVDIGKLTFVVAVHNQKQTKEYENTPDGIKEFIKEYRDVLSKGLCILETTGGYEMRLLLTLCDKNIAVHRANTRNDSGLYHGYRAIGYGRSDIKPILFMSAMAARKSNSSLKTFYNRLIDAGKKKMVALTALMRKIIVIANARLKELELSPS
jgi:transposase